MERKKRKELKWKKLGGGSFSATIDGKRQYIKSGQVFKATEAEIPMAFRNQVECLTKKVEKPEQKQDGKKAAKYKVVPVDGEEDLFDVHDEHGESVNEAQLSEEDAKALIVELTK